MNLCVAWGEHGGMTGRSGVQHSPAVIAFVRSGCALSCARYATSREFVFFDDTALMVGDGKDEYGGVRASMFRIILYDVPLRSRELRLTITTTDPQQRKQITISRFIHYQSKANNYNGIAKNH